MLVQEGTEQDMVAVPEGTEQDMVAVPEVQMLTVLHAEFHVEEVAAAAVLPTLALAREHTHRRPLTST